MEVVVTFYNEKALSVEIPAFVNLKVTETAPGLRGDTVSGASKPATLETGMVIQVPLFINARRRAQGGHAHGHVRHESIAVLRERRAGSRSFGGDRNALWTFKTS